MYVSYNTCRQTKDEDCDLRLQDIDNDINSSASTNSSSSPKH